jgi:hypothetical protein
MPGWPRLAAVLLRACHAAYSDGIAGLAQAAGPAAGLSRLAVVGLADTDHCARMALRWEALAADGTVFPALEADVMLTPAGEQITLLAVAGTYRRQPGWVGAGLDQAIVRRCAAATICGFVARIACALVHPVGQPVPRVLARRAGGRGNRSRNRPVTGPVLGGCHPRIPARAEPRSCLVDLGLNPSLRPVRISSCRCQAGSRRRLIWIRWAGWTVAAHHGRGWRICGHGSRGSCRPGGAGHQRSVARPRHGAARSRPAG